MASVNLLESNFSRKHFTKERKFKWLHPGLYFFFFSIWCFYHVISVEADPLPKSSRKDGLVSLWTLVFLTFKILLGELHPWTEHKTVEHGRRSSCVYIFKFCRNHELNRHHPVLSWYVIPLQVLKEMCSSCKVSIFHGKDPRWELKDSNQSSIFEAHMPLLSISVTMADINNQSCHFLLQSLYAAFFSTHLRKSLPSEMESQWRSNLLFWTCFKSKLHRVI